MICRSVCQIRRRELRCGWRRYLGLDESIRAEALGRVVGCRVELTLWLACVTASVRQAAVWI